jgi:hypothetical protein
MTAADRLTTRDALRFTWHCLVHGSHAHDVWHDVRADVVRCKRCDAQWGGPTQTGANR